MAQAEETYINSRVFASTSVRALIASCDSFREIILHILIYLRPFCISLCCDVFTASSMSSALHFPLIFECRKVALLAHRFK